LFLLFVAPALQDSKKEKSSMCDYSLHCIKNRLANEGEVLVVHRFHTGSKGLTSPEYLKPGAPPENWFAALKKMFAGRTEPCAVCIPDGARLILTGISPALRKAHHLAAIERATFRQLSLQADTYRDAIEFRNGVKIRIQELEEGQHVEVLSLSSERQEVETRTFIPARV
jgi:hypothetical protein